MAYHLNPLHFAFQPFHGLDLALSGHDHDYERFSRMNPAGEATRAGSSSS